MHRRSLTGVFTCLLFLLAGTTGVFAQGQNQLFVPREIVVKLNQASDLPAVASQYGLDATPIEQFGTRPIYRLRINSAAAVPVLAAQMQADPALRVAFAEPNYFVSSPSSHLLPWTQGISWSVGISWSIGGSVKGYSTQWMRTKINLAQAHAASRGQDRRIAVLDTGIDLDHPIFAGRLLPGYDFVDNDNDPREVGTLRTGAYGHGTAVAGIIAMVAPEVKIMPIRILDQDGVGTMWRLAQGLAYAADPDGDGPARGVDIINLSLGTSQRTTLLRKLVAAITNDGTVPDDDDFPSVRRPDIVIVAAAGNTGNSTRIYPAAEHDVPGLIAVGASMPDDSLADFSTRGEWVEIMAPGDRIVSALPGGRFAVWRGTSLSTPIVAGISALVRAKHPTLRAAAVYEQIRRTCIVVQGGGGDTNRRVDAARAVTLNP